jgi:hypothetical protein
MARQTINVGSGDKSGDGENIRSAFVKINENFDELYEEKISLSTLINILEGSSSFEEFKTQMLNR